MKTMNDTERYRENLRDELNGAALYQALAEAENDGKLSEVYRRMAAAERRHAEMWAQKLRATGAPMPPFRASWQTRVLVALARVFGPRAVLPTVLNLEQSDIGDYGRQPDAAPLVRDEQSHARLLRHISRTVPGGMDGGALARLEGRHRAVGGNALRAAVLGANDGLVSNLSLVMGVAGAELASRAIVITGAAGLLAGATSMALGEWLSVQSSRELAERQIRTEAAELEAAPGEELEELSLIYQAKGLDEARAQQTAEEIMSDKGNALATLTREELGIDPEELGGSPWTAGATSFVLFACGAIVPLLPFLLTAGRSAVAFSLAASALGLFGLGAGTTLFTGRNALGAGLRQVAFGLGAAALTYAIGRLLGVSVAG